MTNLKTREDLLKESELLHFKAGKVEGYSSEDCKCRNFARGDNSSVPTEHHVNCSNFDAHKECKVMFGAWFEQCKWIYHARKYIESSDNVSEDSDG